MVYTPKKRPSRKKLALILTGAMVLASAGFLGYKQLRHETKAPATSAPRGTNSVDYSPATPEEKQEVDKTKDAIVKNQQSSGSSSNSNSSQGQKKSANVVIVSPPQGSAVASGDVSISAYVTGVFEDGGTCTATFAKEQTNKSTTSQGFQNSSYTSCAPMSVNLTKGTWKLTVSYSSGTASGEATRNVEVN